MAVIFLDSSHSPKQPRRARPQREVDGKQSPDGHPCPDPSRPFRGDLSAGPSSATGPVSMRTRRPPVPVAG